MAHREGPAGVWWFFLLAFALSGLYCVSRCLVRQDCGRSLREQHASHALMAAGMVTMFGSLMVGGAVRWILEGVFAAVAAYFLVAAARSRRLGRTREMLSGLHHSVANAAMVYMFAMPGLAVVGLTTMLIAYFMVEVLVDGWLLTQDASRGALLRSWQVATHASRILMATGMVYMFAVMDDLANAGMHHHHLG
ncbi:MAG: hypothetical protein QOG45_452 [Chloroflexota bacterium]|nr:hypothetical protein [Chloroflexota bacterium]